MGTRGVYGIRKNGQDKLTYNHWDSYPEHLGYQMAVTCSKASNEELNKIFDNIKLVGADDKPTKKMIQTCEQAGYINLNVGRHSMADVYCLTHGAQGEPQKWLDDLKAGRTIYMIDDSGFLYNGLFCEFAYIINLDTNMLEFLVGFQDEPTEGNRYGCEPRPDHSGRNWYPCKCILEIPLDSINNIEGAKNAVELMFEADQKEFQEK